jgi:D-3-phosphoglycerate dehydrogenase
MAPKALLLEKIDQIAVSILTDSGFDVVTVDGALGEGDLIARLKGVQVLGIRSKTEVTKNVVSAACDLVAVGAFGIGTNQIAVEDCSDAGIAVFNAPFSNTRSVVELALAEIIALTRRLPEKDRAMQAGIWDKSTVGSHEVRGRTLGIVGYGKIGSQLSVLAENLGMRVVYYDLADRLALGNARRCATLSELLADSDVVTLHVDGRSGNQGLFGEAQFSRMRRGAIFLNLSRGFVVDHMALRDHLLSGHLAGAAIDVFADEPLRQGDPFDSELRGLPNVILTPHIGGSTVEAQYDIGQFVATKLRDYTVDGTSSLSVNLPWVGLERRPGTIRLLHLHQNVPGVLAKVNVVLGSHGVNVAGQALGTSGRLGYLLVEVEGELPGPIEAELGDLEETIRVRRL